MSKIQKPIISLLLTAFGLLTLYLSSALIFDLFGERAKQGVFVPAVVWGNLICSLLYLGAVISIQVKHTSSKKFLWVAIVVLLLVGIIFTYQVLTGTSFATKTIGALAFRLVVTGGFIYSLKK